MGEGSRGRKAILSRKMSRKYARKLLPPLISVMVTLLCAEIGLRIAHIGYPDLGGKLHFYTWDPYTGLALRPGAEGMGHEEGDVYWKVNSQGQHDREHSKQKPPNTFRIAVLGDSFAEAMNVPIDKGFSSVLQRELQGCPALQGKNPETINFGVSGFGTAQELQMLRHYAWDYSPDLVLLAFFTGNDVQNNSRALQQDPYRPYFVYQNGKLVLDDSFLRAPGFRSQFNRFHLFLSWAVAHSRVLQVMAAAKNYVSQKTAGGVTSTEMGLNDAVYHAPLDPVWQDAWSVTDGLLVTMNDEIKAKGARFLVVTLSTAIQVDPDPTAREQLEKRLGVPDLLYPDERVNQIAKREGIPVLALAPPFLQYAREHNVQLHGFRANSQGHWNEAGHQLGGELMARKVCQMLQEAPGTESTAHAIADGSWISGRSHVSSPGITNSVRQTGKIRVPAS
jgi:hypothetical protein